MEKLIEQIKLKADSCSNSTKETRARKGAYVDCLVMAKEANKNCRIADVMPSLPLAIEVVEKYLNENFWFDHFYENGYPTKVMAKADFLGMLNELKLKLANGNGA